MMKLFFSLRGFFTAELQCNTLVFHKLFLCHTACCSNKQTFICNNRKTYITQATLLYLLTLRNDCEILFWVMFAVTWQDNSLPDVLCWFSDAFLKISWTDLEQHTSIFIQPANAIFPFAL